MATHTADVQATLDTMMKAIQKQRKEEKVALYDKPVKG